jgi:hypothetical protein
VISIKPLKMTKIKFIIAIICANMMFSCGPMSKEINLATLEADIIDIKKNNTDLDSLEIVYLNDLLTLSSDKKYFEENTTTSLIKINEVEFELNRNIFFDFIHKKGYTYSELLSELKIKDEIINETYENNSAIFKSIDSLCAVKQNSLNMLKDSLDENKIKIRSINWFPDMYYSNKGQFIVDYNIITLIENNSNEVITGIEYNFLINNGIQKTISKSIIVQANNSKLDTLAINKDDLSKFAIVFLDTKKYSIDLISVSFLKHKVNYSLGKIKSTEILRNFDYRTPKKLTLECPYLIDNELLSRVFQVNGDIREKFEEKIPAWIKFQELLKKLG